MILLIILGTVFGLEYQKVFSYNGKYAHVISSECNAKFIDDQPRLYNIIDQQYQFEWLMTCSDNKECSAKVQFSDEGTNICCCEGKQLVILIILYFLYN